MRYQLYTQPDQPLTIPSLEGVNHHALLKVYLSNPSMCEPVAHQVWESLESHLQSLRVQFGASETDSVELIMTHNPFEGIPF